MWRQLSTLTRIVQPAVLSNSALFNCWRNFSLLSANINRNVMPNAIGRPCLLQPVSLAMNFERGFKQKGRLRRRCKDCYFVMREERLYVICKTHPRHKQMQMKKSEKNSWILTDATQSPIRAW